MICRHLRSVALVAFVAGSAVQPALATHENPPAPGANDRMWLSVGGTTCHDDSPNGTPTCPNGGSASGFLDQSVERATGANQAQGITLKGGGSTSANSLAVFLQSNSVFGRTTAVVEDTYLLSGPAGSIDLGVVFTAEGVFDILNHPIGRPLGQGNAQIRVGGAMDASGTAVVPTLGIASFDTPFVNGGSPAPFPFQIGISFDLPVTVGTPFDLAFLLSVSSVHAVRANALNTALIDFDLPDGYALTSALGWTSPFQADGPMQTPAPAALWVIVPALGWLGFVMRRRR